MSELGTKASPHTRRGVDLFALLAGGLVAVAIVAPTFLAPGANPGRPPPTAGCGFLVGVVLTSQAETPGEFLYNFTVRSVSQGEASTSWTQFSGFNASTYAEIPLLVRVLTPGGTSVALFNSSRSAFSLGSNLSSSTFPNLGGWEVGYGQPVVVNDTFAIESPVDLNTTASSTYLEMASVAAPHCFMGYTILS